MNSPIPVPTSVPVSTPTLGAAIGGLVTVAVAHYVAAVPGAETALSILVPAFFSWLSHRIHSRVLNRQLG